MRKSNSITKNDIWNCKIIDTNDVVIKDANYKTIQHIADDIGLSYNQVIDHREGGRCKKKCSKFKFQPTIIVKRLNPTQKEYYDKRRIEKAKKCLENNNNVEI